MRGRQMAPKKYRVVKNMVWLSSRKNNYKRVRRRTAPPTVRNNLGEGEGRACLTPLQTPLQEYTEGFLS